MPAPPSWQVDQVICIGRYSRCELTSNYRKVFHLSNCCDFQETDTKKKIFSI